MSDISEFLQSYHEILRQEIANAKMPPELTERFTFESCVKRENGREVYFVRRKSDGKRAVLRINDAANQEAAEIESAMLKRLDHPAIPKILGVWEYEDRSYLLREYFKGDDLRTYIQKYGTLSKEHILDIALQLCDILIYIHEQEPIVVHRDLKPENIILSGRHGVKLIDFEIARRFKPDESKINDTRIMGTRPYMAPEQFGSEQTDHRADLYALGMVLVFMGTGQTEIRDLRKIYPYKDLVSIIEKCMKKDREQRFSTAAQLKRRMLRIRHRRKQRMIMIFGIALCLSATFFLGRYVGKREGFQKGVDSILEVPTEQDRPFTPEELNEPVQFDSWYLDMAVRNALNKQPEEIIYRTEVNSRIDTIRIFGTWILHPSLEDRLIKKHVAKGTVNYMSGSGIRIDTRGDVGSLKDIPNMYYLRTLVLNSQSISDLAPLSGMKLESLNMSNNFVGNLLPLKDMVTLRQLDLCQNPLRDLRPLARLLSLEFLDISQTQVTDLTPLKELTKLEVLRLNYCDVKDIDILQDFPNLKEVDLSNTLVTDLTPLLREHDPITVYCAGLAEEVLDAVRDDARIVIVEKAERE